MPRIVTNKLASLENVDDELKNNSSEEEEEEKDALDFIKDNSAAKVSSVDIKNKNNVIYIGHLPNGMEESELALFLAQFGLIESLKLSRSNKAPHRSRGYCFVKFQDSSVAAIVATTLSGYIVMQEKRLVSHVVPYENVHPNLFKHSKTPSTKNKELVLDTVRKQQQLHAYQHNHKVAQVFSSKEKVQELSNRLCKQETKKRQKLSDLGIDYEFPGYTSSFKSNNITIEKEEQRAVESEENRKNSAPSQETRVVSSVINSTPSKSARFRSPIGTRSAKKRAMVSVIDHSKTDDEKEGKTESSNSKKRPIIKTDETVVVSSKTPVAARETIVVFDTPSKATNPLRSPIGTRSSRKSHKDDAKSSLGKKVAVINKLGMVEADSFLEGEEAERKCGGRKRPTKEKEAIDSNNIAAVINTQFKPKEVKRPAGEKTKHSVAEKRIDGDVAPSTAIHVKKRSDNEPVVSKTVSASKTKTDRADAPVKKGTALKAAKSDTPSKRRAPK